MKTDNATIPPPETFPASEVNNRPAGTEGRPRSRFLPLALVIAIALIVAAAAYYIIAVHPYETTDDAFIDGHAIQISPKVAGRVSKVLITDNQFVKKGDSLVQIDPADYDAALAQAQANLAAAQSRLVEAQQQVIVSHAKADQDRAAVGAADAEAKRTQMDLDRYQSVESRAVSRQQVDAATAAAQSAAASLEEARKKADASEAQVGLDQAQIPTAKAVVQQMQAGLRQGELNLSYANIVAPEDGWVTHRVVEDGEYVQVGQALLAVVQPNVWVTANFKETQLTNMKPGQPAWLEVDAYPHHKFKGHVDSIQAGTGVQFSLLPPENAAGNYVKVVQRVPVKIVFDEGLDSQQMLPLGGIRRTQGEGTMSEAATVRDDEALWKQPYNPWIIAMVVTMATFMEVLDTSVANVSLPHIAGNLSAGVDESTWVLTSYLMSNAVVLPLSGWLSEMIGRKRFYMSCVALFTIGSLLCGLAPSLGWLVFFRVLQGAGGGGLQPSEQAILADTFPPAKRGMAFAMYGMAVVAAPALGPTLGGWITDNYTWRWIFFINVPIGILSLLLTSRLISDPPYLKKKKHAGVKIDYIGFAAIALGLATLQFVLDKGQRDDWFESPYIRVFSVISLTCLAFTLIWEWRVKDPIVELRLFKDRTFLMGNVMLFTVGFALYSSTVLLPEYCQELMGYTAKQAGMVISPGGVAIMLLMPLIGYIVSRYDARKIIAFGFFIVGISLFNMMRFNLQVDFGTMMWARVLQGAGVAFLFVPINTAAYANVPREKSNAASGLINLSRNIGGSVGISFVTTMLARRAQFHQVALSEHMNHYNPHFMATWNKLASGFAASGMDAVTASKQAIAVFGLILSQQATLLAFIDNFWLLGLSMFLLVPLTFLMKKAKPGGPIAVH